MPKSVQTVGDVVRAARESRGMRPGALAKKAKIGRSTLWRIETNKFPPDLLTLARISEALDYDFSIQLQQTGSNPYVITALVEADRE